MNSCPKLGEEIFLSLLICSTTWLGASWRQPRRHRGVSIPASLEPPLLPHAFIDRCGTFHYRFPWFRSCSPSGHHQPCSTKKPEHPCLCTPTLDMIFGLAGCNRHILQSRTTGIVSAKHFEFTRRSHRHSQSIPNFSGQDTDHRVMTLIDEPWKSMS
ncbi:hypothetical protein EV356DRAFT_34092 [Viridothelium virens]|uniref:Secreted protein n=1 Tax=Viridothelium virens TaxID=1048519 RepID=A0A6A6GT84_VIRVR|nr:hypothetical protein EV356DRAFT_34092 [Viridothelium virens]